MDGIRNKSEIKAYNLQMSSTVVLTVGLFPTGGRTPIFTTRRINYTDLATIDTALISVLTTPPFLAYVPVPPEPVPEEPIVVE